MDEIVLALDWTPNINHIGFFVAFDQGFYADEKLEVIFLNPQDDNYKITPAKKVELGLADFALCPMESVLSYRTKSEPFSLKAVGAIYQEDLSAIVTLASSDLNSPKALDGKSYASYQARYEDEIVKQMIRNDGGRGEIEIGYPAKLGIWNTLLNAEFDATWIFINWEGVQAEAEGVDLNLFRLKDYGIPYSYSPILAADEKKISSHRKSYQAFLNASKQGFLHAKENPDQAIKVLSGLVPNHDKNIDLGRSLELSARHFGNKTSWGRMDPNNVDAYLQWIYGQGLETQKLGSEELFTNELLG